MGDKDVMEVLNDLRRTAEEVAEQFNDCGGHYEYTGSMNAVEDLRDAVKQAREYWIEKMR
jgi:hypothetical protein